MKRAIICAFAVATLMISYVSTASAKQTKKSDATQECCDDKFVFTVYSMPEARNNAYGNYILGSDVASKLTLMEELYMKRSSVTVGISSSSVTIAKPSIFNAVNKMNKYYSKQVQNNEIPKEEAQKQLSYYLDCANVMYYDENTLAFEKELLRARKVEQVIALFERVELKSL